MPASTGSPYNLEYPTSTDEVKAFPALMKSFADKVASELAKLKRATESSSQSGNSVIPFTHSSLGLRKQMYINHETGLTAITNGDPYVDQSRNFAGFLQVMHQWKTLTSTTKYTRAGGVVYVQVDGQSSGTSETSIGTLPQDYRPSIKVQCGAFDEYNTSYPCRVIVETSGTVKVQGTRSSARIYGSISFPISYLTT